MNNLTNKVENEELQNEMNKSMDELKKQILLNDIRIEKLLKHLIRSETKKIDKVIDLYEQCKNRLSEFK